LVDVLHYLIQVQKAFNNSSETSRLTAWATAAKPSDYDALGIRGFGLSGFQYLRILFGVQTVKPDRHICRFVSKAVGRTVQDVQALSLLEAAGRHLEWQLSALDFAIWERLSSGEVVPVRSREGAISRNDLEAALAVAPVCWTYSSARPRYVYFSMDNKTTTKAARQFPFADVAGMLVQTKTTKDYNYWALVPVHSDR
jgi:hypothetical protein